MTHTEAIRRLQKLYALRGRVNEEIAALEAASRALVKPSEPPPGPPEPTFCGTERGYQWHRYNDRDNWPLPLDDPCGCRAAHRAWWHFTKWEKADDRVKGSAA
jgi:hypothetical protein